MGLAGPRELGPPGEQVHRALAGPRASPADTEHSPPLAAVSTLPGQDPWPVGSSLHRGHPQPPRPPLGWACCLCLRLDTVQAVRAPGSAAPLSLRQTPAPRPVGFSGAGDQRPPCFSDRPAFSGGERGTFPGALETAGQPPGQAQPRDAAFLCASGHYLLIPGRLPAAPEPGTAVRLYSLSDGPV